MYKRWVLFQLEARTKPHTTGTVPYSLLSVCKPVKKTHSLRR